MYLYYMKCWNLSCIFASFDCVSTTSSSFTSTNAITASFKTIYTTNVSVLHEKCWNLTSLNASFYCVSTTCCSFMNMSAISASFYTIYTTNVSVLHPMLEFKLYKCII